MTDPAVRVLLIRYNHRQFIDASGFSSVPLEIRAFAGVEDAQRFVLSEDDSEENRAKYRSYVEEMTDVVRKQLDKYRFQRGSEAIIREMALSYEDWLIETKYALVSCDSGVFKTDLHLDAEVSKNYDTDEN